MVFVANFEHVFVCWERYGIAIIICFYFYDLFFDFTVDFKQISRLDLLFSVNTFKHVLSRLLG